MTNPPLLTVIVPEVYNGGFEQHGPEPLTVKVPLMIRVPAFFNSYPLAIVPLLMVIFTSEPALRVPLLTFNVPMVNVAEPLLLARLIVTDDEEPVTVNELRLTLAMSINDIDVEPAFIVISSPLPGTAAGVQLPLYDQLPPDAGPLHVLAVASADV